MAQGIKEQIGAVAAIEAECHLVQVGREMLGADAMPCPDNASFQKAKGVLDGVRMNIAVNIDSRLVFDGLVLRLVLTHSGGIRPVFVGHYHVNIFRDIVPDECSQCSRLRIASMEESEVATALSDADDDLLSALTESWFALMASLLSADISFIYLDSSPKCWLLNFAHSSPDAMAEIPCGFIGALVLSPERPAQLVSGESLACFNQQQGCSEPDFQRQMRVIEDRTRRDAELIIALFAVEQLLSCCQLYGRAAAARALRAIRPAQTRKKRSAFFVGIKQVVEVN